MSFFTRIVSNVKEFYSEINQATLTGAIDVIVVRQDDGTFKSSPFHVRFGKLGVLQAREKIVDLEINGEPVELQMKLDDTGAAFFVHQLDDNQEDDVDSPDLATSPIPEQKIRWRERKSGNFQPISLFPKTEGLSGTPKVDHVRLQSTVGEHTESSPEDRILNADSAGKIDFLRKQTKSYLKKRRRKKRGHSRGGSKSSLKEIMMNSEHDMFLMDDVNDADQENDEHEEDDEQSFSSPETKLSIEFANAFDLSSSMVHGELHRADSINTDEVTVENSLIGSRVPLIPKSSSEAEALAALLVVDSDVDVDMETAEQFRPKSVAADFHYFSDGDVDTVVMNRSSTPLCVVSDSEFENSQRREEDQNVWRWGELPNRSHDNGADNGEKNIQDELKEAGGSGEKEKSSWFGVWGASKNNEVKNEEIKTEDPPGIYLDDLMADPDKLAFYLNPIGSLPEIPVRDEEDPLGDGAGYVDEDLESGNGHSLPVSPASGVRVAPEGVRHASSNYESDMELQDLPSLISKHLPDLAASLCGGLNDSSITLESFEAQMLTYTEFLERMKTSKDFLITDPNLVIRVHDKYLSWSSAAPILLSVMLYRQPLPVDLIQEITKEGIDVNVTLSPEEMKNNRVGAKKSSTWFGWLSGTKPKEEIKQEEDASEGPKTVTDKADHVDMSCQAGEGSNEAHNLKVEIKEETKQNSIIIDKEFEEEDLKRFRKTLRLSSEQLAELNLRSGSNEIQFSVTTAFQGTSRCMCHIYLWDHTDKVVISDIDGTITKSDVLGHILPVIGRDWAQSGVARLFSKIRNNGYHMIYLSARAIGQASITKDYLQSVKQGEVSLPDGPMFLNPDSLIHAFRREMIDRNPEEFKIRCLKDIYSLFEGKNPFFAGYGNRPNDAFAYAAVGIPVSRIFTVNPAGELKHELKQNFQTSYVEQDKMVDQVFPPIGFGFDPDFKIQEFSSFGFWREAPLAVDLVDLEIMLKASS